MLETPPITITQTDTHVAITATATSGRIPRVGDDVLYVLESGPNAGKIRPGKIVHVWGTTANSTVQLQVFTDGGNDGQQYQAGIYWATSVTHSAPIKGEPLAKRTYHFPEERL